MLIEEQLVTYLRENGLTVASAESCTGGLISKRITDISGSSFVFGYGLCTYANEAKTKLLGVTEEALKNYGAVSSVVAEQMAAGLLLLSCADVVVCTTGMASPGFYPTDKPVGMVFLGVGSKKFGVKSVELSLGHLITREKIRYAAATEALEYALSEAKKVIENQGF